MYSKHCNRTKQEIKNGTFNYFGNSRESRMKAIETKRRLGHPIGATSESSKKAWITRRKNKTMNTLDNTLVLSNRS